MASDPFQFLEKEKPVELPLWREAFWGLDWMKLRVNPVALGLGVPRGNGDIHA